MFAFFKVPELFQSARPPLFVCFRRGLPGNVVSFGEFAATLGGITALSLSLQATTHFE